MGSQRCLLRPSVCKSLEQQDARHSPLLDVCFPVERSNLCVFAAVSPRFHPFCRTRPIVPLTFAFFLPLFPSACRQDEDTHCSLFCLLASTSLRIPWAPPEPRQQQFQEILGGGELTQVPLETIVTLARRRVQEARPGEFKE